jgi:hypothetical protein
MHRRNIALAVALTLRVSSPAFAQTDFGSMRAKIGDVLYITDPDRQAQIIGRLTHLSAKEITIDGYRFEPKPGLKIERQRDSIGFGAVLGFVLGGFSGVIGGECFVPCFVGGGLLYGWLGAHLDPHKKRVMLFQGGPDAGASPQRSAMTPLQIAEFRLQIEFQIADNRNLKSAIRNLPLQRSRRGCITAGHSVTNDSGKPEPAVRTCA